MELIIALGAVTAVILALVTLAFKLRRWHWELNTQVNALRQDFARLSKVTVKSINQAVDSSTREVLNAVGLSALDFSFPVMLGGFSIDAHHARLLVEVLNEHKPRRILELGSGTSTVIIAKTLQALGQQAELHIAVDHDARYLDLTRQQCRLNGVEHLVQFEHCPLESRLDSSLPWYSRLPDLLGEGKIDLLLVDGPPAFPEGRERIREPALDVLADYCSDAAFVLLDDANRPGETAIVTAWLERHPDYRCQRRRDGKGIAILSRNGTFIA